MWIERLVSSRTTHAVELTAQFAEQRQRVLAQNLANIDTPDYQQRHLDVEPFQRSLREALDTSRAERRNRLQLQGNAQFSHGPGGQVSVRPGEEVAPNALFHDGTNARLETLLAQTAENNLSYGLATSILRKRFDGLMRAIRGRST